MADDIEEFLKRVAEKRRGQQGGRSQSSQPRPAPPPQRPPAQQRPSQPPQPKPPPVVQRAPLTPVEPIQTPETSIHQLSTNDVQQHAQQYMSRREFEERSKQVGLHAKPIAHLESNMAKAHAARKAESHVGPVREAQAFPDTVSGSLDVESTIAKLFRSPEAFRSAFLMSLVLDRPAWKED